MINELFFTTHNLDILDLSLCKHSFNFLKKDDCGISIVNAADYLKKSADSSRGEYVIIISSISPRLKSRGHKYFINKFFFHALCVTMKKRWYTTEHVRVSRYSTQ